MVSALPTAVLLGALCGCSAGEPLPAEVEQSIEWIDSQIAHLQLQRQRQLQRARASRAAASDLVVYRSPKFALHSRYNVTYAQGQNCSAQGYGGPCVPMDLLMDVHSPVLNSSVGLQPPKLKPAVLLFHGGGWGGGDKSGAGGQPYMEAQCQRWTSRGFVVFNADYRLGTNVVMPDEKSVACPHPKSDGSNAAYQVCGDFPPCCNGPTKPFTGTNKMPPPHWGHFDNSSACERDPFDALPTRYGNRTQCPPYTSAYPANRDAKAAVRFVRKHAAEFGVSPEHLISLGCEYRLLDLPPARTLRVCVTELRVRVLAAAQALRAAGPRLRWLLPQRRSGATSCLGTTRRYRLPILAFHPRWLRRW